MTTRSIILILLIATILCVPVSAADVTYPQEYYTLGNATSSWISDVLTNSLLAANMDSIRNFEMHRQSILMEMQNELLAEQNELIKRQMLVWNDSFYYMDLGCEGMTQNNDSEQSGKAMDYSRVSGALDDAVRSAGDGVRGGKKNE
jgi:hypothetical protein